MVRQDAPYNCKTSGDIIKGILQKEGIAMTGRKEELLDKLAKLAVLEYQDQNDTLTEYFGRNRFVRVDHETKEGTSSFPVLKDSLLRNLVLTMYAMMHLRGTVILEPDYINDTYTLEDMAKALIEKRVNLEGFFVKAG